MEHIVAPSFTRAVLALLCAFSVIYGTAVFPAAFDVELRAEQPSMGGGPDAPDEPPEHVTDGPGEPPGDATPSSADIATATATPTDTPRSASSETATPAPPPQNDGDAGGEEGLGGLVSVLSGLFVVGFLGVFVLGVLAIFREGTGDFSFGLLDISLPWFVPALSLRRIPQLTTWLLIAGASGLARVVEGVTVLARALGSTVANGVGPVVRIVGRSLAALPRTAVALVAAPVRALGTAATLLGGFAFLRRTVSRPGFIRSETPTTDVRAESDAVPVTDEEPDHVTSVPGAWRAMADHVPVRNPEATTASEYARRAVTLGLPEGPVERLTDLFREVRYGGYPDSSERVSVARRALDALRGGDD